MGSDSYKIGDVVYVTIGKRDAIPVTIDSIDFSGCDPLALSTIHVFGHQNFWDEKQSKSDHGVIKKVIYNPPATIIFWADGTKTVVKCMEGDEFDPEKGLAIGIAQKFVPKKEIKKWLPKNWELPEEEVPDLQQPDKGLRFSKNLVQGLEDAFEIFKSAVKGE